MLGDKSSNFGHLRTHDERLVRLGMLADFTKYDGHATQQIKRDIELIRYRPFGEELRLLDLDNATGANGGRGLAAKAAKAPKSPPAELLALQADLDAARPLILMAYEGRAVAPTPASGIGSR
jgi:hypothetical protein